MPPTWNPGLQGSVNFFSPLPSCQRPELSHPSWSDASMLIMTWPVNIHHCAHTLYHLLLILNHLPHSTANEAEMMVQGLSDQTLKVDATHDDKFMVEW